MFKYFAGASTAAGRLPHMLQALETALKDFFHLREMEVRASVLTIDAVLQCICKV